MHNSLNQYSGQQAVRGIDFFCIHVKLILRGHPALIDTNQLSNISENFLAIETEISKSPRIIVTVMKTS